MGSVKRRQNVRQAIALGVTLLLLEDELALQLADGSLVRVLEKWCPGFAGYRLYYPSRRQPSPAFNLVLHAMRLRAGGSA